MNLKLIVLLAMTVVLSSTACYADVKAGERWFSYPISLVPRLTGEDERISATSEGWGSQSWWLFDKNVSTIWAASGGKDTAYIGWDTGVGNSAIITSYSMTAGNDGYWDGASFMTFKLYGSNNGSDWTELDSQEDLHWGSSETKEFILAATPAAYRYFKVEGIARTYACAMAEWVLMGFPS